MSSQNSLISVKNSPEGISTLILNNPDELNALSFEMAEEFTREISTLSKDPQLRLLVIRGAGDRAFSSGGNLDMLLEKSKRDKSTNEKDMYEFYRSYLSILKIPVPTLAAINGHAVGAGLCLALACDIRIATEKAKLGLNFVKLGLHPGMAASALAQAHCGISKARELLFTGRIFSASEGKEFGLVNHCFRDSEFEDRLTEISNDIASSSPLAVRQLKQTLRENFPDLEKTLRREALCQAENYASEDFLEGIRAAKEKRKPSF